MNLNALIVASVKGSLRSKKLETGLEVCQHTSTLSEAGRHLYSVSRQHKKQPNDADRLRKYLMRFGLCWENIQKK